MAAGLMGDWEDIDAICRGVEHRHDVIQKKLAIIADKVRSVSEEIEVTRLGDEGRRYVSVNAPRVKSQEDIDMEEAMEEVNRIAPGIPHSIENRW